MDPQNMQNQDMGLVLSSDAKPRLKWTPELHQRFIDAVAHLGGPDKATPKTLMRVMAIPGLTLYHLKSHLQKFRLGQRQQSETYNGNKQEDYSDDAEYRENHRRDCHFNGEIISSDGTQNQINEGLQIAQALQMQMEVQRKLHEQMEVQRHLQLRIEAQGKYLKSVLKKAQETLAGYNSASSGVELVKAELSQLVSMAITGCPSSSVLTEIEDSSLKETERQSMKGTGGSLESSLTSSESSGRKEENQSDKSEKSSLVLSLMDMNSRDRSGGSRKRSGGDQQEQTYGKRSTTHKEKSGGGGDQLRKINSIGWFDLNSKCVGELGGSGAKAIDLNCKGTEQFNGHV
ncbi:myb family transcription factor PHL8-like [Cornus florida]|uniref:myb family transcription factor PHL8-like n=1 Tax=Cornus florida TaxID=4283 RepID=UPI00289D28AE|nr:myb family transcription factor PHL8-like [Cornus florida]